MKAAVYTRVSTRKRRAEDPDDSSTLRDYRQNPALQVEACERFCVNKELEVVARFSDRISGKDDSRPGLKELMDGAYRREFDAVVVWKVDRFGRSVVSIIENINRLAGWGVQFLSVTDSGIDPSTPSGKVFLAILAAIAEWEHDIIAERVKAGMASARNRGKRMGRPRVTVPIGLIRDAMEQGMTLSAAAKKYQVPRETAARALRLHQKASPEPTLQDQQNQG